MIFLWVPETKLRTLEELDYICKFSELFTSMMVLTMTQSVSPRAGICIIKCLRSYRGRSDTTYYEIRGSYVHCTNFNVRMIELARFWADSY